MAPDTSITVGAKSSVQASVPDNSAGKIKVLCPNAGLHKDEVPCEILLGGAGGAGVHTDTAFAFKYVSKISINKQLNMYLICTAM